MEAHMRRPATAVPSVEVVVFGLWAPRRPAAVGAPPPGAALRALAAARPGLRPALRPGWRGPPLTND
jgi:hypothetical protein